MNGIITPLLAYAQENRFGNVCTLKMIQDAWAPSACSRTASASHGLGFRVDVGGSCG